MCIYIHDSNMCVYIYTKEKNIRILSVTEFLGEVRIFVFYGGA